VPNLQTLLAAHVAFWSSRLVGLGTVPWNIWLVLLWPIYLISSLGSFFLFAVAVGLFGGYLRRYAKRSPLQQAILCSILATAIAAFALRATSLVRQHELRCSCPPFPLKTLPLLTGSRC
jgi:hypothetical protein